MAVTPIGELIEEVRAAFLDEHGTTLSYADLASRSGGEISRQQMHAYATGDLTRMPPPETIEAMATALRVSKGLVLQRMLESVGYELPSDFPVAARRGIPKRLRVADDTGV